jgi:protein dithiol:quinone oxidoreductase
MNYLSSRMVNLYIFLACAALLGTGYYMQFVMRLEPCHLCIMQRLFYYATGLVALAAFIHNPQGRGRKIYGFGTAAMALAGAGFAMRQVYLQHLPRDQVPACGPSLEYMLQEFPLKETLIAMLSGDGNCAELQWQDPIFNLSIAELSLIAFGALFAVSLFQAFRR